MSELLSYPIQEHIDRRTSPTAVLWDELFYYSDHDSFKKNVASLGQVYNTIVNAPITKPMMRFAIMLNVARVWCGVSEPAENGYDEGFYGGQILGLHTALSATHTKAFRQYVMNAVPTLHVGDSETEDENTMKQMGKILELVDDPYKLAEEILDEEHRDALVEATILYAPEDEIRQQSFMAGYLYAYGLYCGYVQQVNARSL